jgi:hypothetical protein
MAAETDSFTGQLDSTPSKKAAKMFIDAVAQMDAYRWSIVHDELEPGDVPLYLLYTFMLRSGEEGEPARGLRFVALRWEDVRQSKAGYPHVALKADPTAPEDYPRVEFMLNGDIVRALDEKYGDGAEAFRTRMEQMVVHVAADANGLQAAATVVGDARPGRA